MSTKTIDQRVVEMQFDNKNFEKNVSQSMSTIDKLKQSLNFSGASKGLDDLSAHTKSLDFSPISNAVDTISTKFSALETIAVGALIRIGSQIADTGIKLVKSLSVDNISAGWEKFGEKTNAVATLSAQGYSTEEITDQIERLNWFTDETSYNLTDMTREIGKFTAAGQDLESSVTAMEGIATIAALAGQNAQTASRAMYQISQAMGKGVMRADDWKSVENANMVSTELKQNIIDTAVALGTLKDNLDGTYTSIVDGYKEVTFDVNSFTSSLTEGGWFTSDVMMNVFKDYGKAANALQAYVEKAVDDEIETASDAIADLKQKASDYQAEMAAVGEDLSYDEALKHISLEQMKEIPAVVDEAEAHIKEYNESIKQEAENYIKLHPEIKSVEAALKALGLTEMTTIDESLIDLGYQLDELSLKAFEAGQEARTFKDVIGSVQDAVSTGWMTTFENIFGDYDEAKALWTDLANELYEVFAEGGNERNEMLSTWKEMGGRNLLFANAEGEIGAFWNLFYALTDVINAVKDAFHDIFPPMTAEKLYDITEKFAKFTEKLRLNEEQLDKVRKIFRGLFSAIDLVARVVAAVVKGFQPLVPIFKKLGDYILTLITRFTDWTTATDEEFKELDKFAKITEFISNVIQKIIDVISNVIDVFKRLGNAIREAFTSGGEGITFGERMSKIFNVLSDIVTFFVNVFTGFGNVVKSIWGFVKPILDSMITAIGDTFKQIGAALNGTLSQVDANKLFENIFATLKTGLAAVTTIGIASIVNNVRKEFKGLFGFKDIAKNISEMFKGITGIADSVSGIFDKLKGTLTAYQNELKASTLLKIAAAIGILTLSLVVLASMDQDALKEAISAITVLFSELVASFALLNKSMSKSKKLNLALLGLALIELSISLVILASFMKKVADMEWEGIIKSMVAMAAAVNIMPMALNGIKNTKGLVGKGLSLILIATSLVILGNAMEKIAEISWDGIAKALISVSISLYVMGQILNTMKSFGNIGKATSLILVATSLVILGSAMQKIAEISWEGIAKSLVSVSVALYVMSQIMNTMKTFGNFGKATSIILMATSLLILGEAMEKLSTLSWEGIAKSLVSIVVVLYVMSQIMNTMKTFGNFGKATSLILLATSLVILGVAMQKIAEISWDGIIKALISMIFALGFIVDSMNTINTKGLLRKALSLVIVFATMHILASAMKEIASMSWEGIGKALASMVISLYVMVGAINGVKPPSTAKATSITIIASSLRMIGEYMLSVAELSWEGIAKSLVGMAGALAIMVLALNMMNFEGGGISKAVTLIVVAAAIAMIAGALSALASVGWVGLIAGLLGLVAVFVIIGVAAKVLGPMTGQILSLSLSIMSISVSFMMFAASAFMFGAALAAIGIGLSLVGASMVPLAVGLQKFIPVLVEQLPTLIIGIAQTITESAPYIAEAIITLIRNILEVIEAVVPDVIATLLRTVFKALDALTDNIPELIGKIVELVGIVLNTLLEILPDWGPKIFEIIIMLLGMLVDYMPQIVDKLVDLVISLLMSLASRVPDILGAVVEFLRALLEGVITALGTLLGDFIGAIINGAATVIADGLPHIGEKLSEFSDALQPFLDMTGGISEESMRGVKELAETILIITAAELLSGVSDFLSFFTGSTPDKFGDTIVSFGESMVKFADVTKGIDNKQVENSAVAAKALADFANALPKEEGLWQQFFGTGDLTKFGAELETFAPHFVEYAKKVSEISDFDAVTTSANAAKALADFATNLPPHDGEWQKFFGDASLESFAIELERFAPAIVSYAKQVKGLDSEAIEKSAAAAQILSTLEDNLPDHGGVVQWFTGDSTLAGFAGELLLFAPALVSYSEIVKDLDANVIEKSAAAAGALSALESGLADSGGVVAFFAGDNTLKGFGESLEAFGQSFSIYYNSVLGINPDNIKGVTQATKDFVDICLTMQQVDIEVPERFGEVLERLGYALIDGFSKSFEGGKQTIDDAINGVIDKVYEEFENARPFFLRYGEYFMQEFIDGIANKNRFVINVATNVANNAKKQFENKYDDFKNAGIYLVSGFETGLDTDLSGVRNKATAIAQAAIDAMKEALDEHSPSKVMYEIGSFAGEGFVNALDQYAVISNEVGMNVGESATDGIREALEKSAAVFDTSVDVEPTIRPVLDLSDVNAGIGELDGMFDATRSMALAGSANIAMGTNGLEVQNEIKVDNSDVVNAITGLQEDMIAMTEKITNMQIYLDKNVLVGQMADPMNKALGTSYRRNMRE